MNITANLNTLADSLRAWSSPALSQIRIAAEHQTQAQLVNNWIGLLLWGIVLFVCVYYLVKIRNKDTFTTVSEDTAAGFCIIGLLLSILLIGFMLNSIIKISISPDYRTLENMMSLAGKLRVR